MKLRKIVAGTSALALLLSMAACGEGDAEVVTTAATTTTTEETVDDEIDNPVDVSEIDLEVGDAAKVDVKPVTLKYVGNYNMTTAGDIKPAVKYFAQQYGYNDAGIDPIEVQIVAYDAIEETISLGIQSDDSADLVDKQDNTYPLWMSKNLYMPLDGYIDMTSPQWSNLNEYVERYSWGGNHYYYPWSYDVSPYFLIYNRGVFEEKGITDPYELYQEGNWNWDTFKTAMVDFVGGDSDKLGFYGYYATSFINSNGTSLVGIDEEGKLTNNMKSTAVEQAQSFLEGLRKEGLGNHQYKDYNNVDETAVIEGNAAFHVVGGWKITDYSKKMKKDASLDIFFVPVPRSPYTDKYYYALSTFGYLVPAGSPNAQLSSLFINCCRLSITDPELKATTRESIMKNKKYTDEQYNFLEQFKLVENYDCIVDESLGFPKDVTEIVKDMIGDVGFDQTEEQKSWSQMRDENYNIVQDAIDAYNAYLD